jgi:hypothetical protein
MYCDFGNNSGVLRMLRATRSVLGAAAVLFGGVLLAQPPKGGAPADTYYPLKKDTKWTYKVGDNFVEVRVAKVEKVNNEDHYLLETVVGKEAKTSEMIVVRPDGVYRTKVKDDKLDPYVKMLPLPPTKDATWDVNSKLGTQTVKGTMKVLGDKDKIKVQGTDYEAVHVEGKDLDIAGAKTTVNIWYAKDRGIVKQEFVLQTGDKVILELVKYEEGK